MASERVGSLTEGDQVVVGVYQRNLRIPYQYDTCATFVMRKPSSPFSFPICIEPPAFSDGTRPELVGSQHRVLWMNAGLIRLDSVP